MDTKRMIMLIVSLLLGIALVGFGFWLMTEPPQGAKTFEVKQCREYQEELDKVNKYKLVWSIQRRLAFSDCIEKLVKERHNQPEEDHTLSTN